MNVSKDEMSWQMPQNLPRLERGRHEHIDDGACAMEAASWLAGEPWSDHPATVHPVIARVARATNDTVSDDERQLLWPLILDSIGTAQRSWRLDRRLRRLVRDAEASSGFRQLARDGVQLQKLWISLLEERRLYLGRPERSADSSPPSVAPPSVVDAPRAHDRVLSD